MQDNFFVVKELSSYLNEVLTGAEIIECFSQEKNKLIIHLNKSGYDYFIEYSCGDEFPFLILKNKYSKAKKNVAHLFKSLNGIFVKQIYQKANDRLICFELDDSGIFIFSFIKLKLNCFIVRNGILTEAFKENNLYIDKEFNKLFIPKFSGDKQILCVKDYLKHKYFNFDRLYQNEVLFLLELKNNDKINESLISQIDFEFEKIKKDLENPVFIIYYINEKPYLSLINLTSLETSGEKKLFENINLLLSEYIHDYFKRGTISGIKEQKLKSLNSEVLKNEKRLSNLNNHYKEALDSYEKNREIGNQILTNLDIIKKGEKEFELTIFDKPEIVKLDVNLSPSENAQKYFSKYKKQKSSLELLKGKIEKLELKINSLKMQVTGIENLEDVKGIKKLEIKSKKMNKEDETSKFRKFVLNQDFQVWVGKDSKSNDLLTTKYSAQNDLWFHIRGTSGSHTVLKTGNKNEQLDKKIIETAASICAYYSKARNAGTVPVAYCLRKYVKKKKGFKEGSVIMEKEKVIFVKPKLPDDLVEN